MLADSWKKWDDKICGDNITTELFVNLTYLAFKSISTKLVK